MAGLRCDISAEVDGCARRLKGHFESILLKAGVGAGAADVLTDVRDIEGILKDAMPLEELFALREGVRAACGAGRIQELERAVEEHGDEIAKLEER